jgi:hypothetical protein
MNNAGFHFFKLKPMGFTTEVLRKGDANSRRRLGWNQENGNQAWHCARQLKINLELLRRFAGTRREG